MPESIMELLQRLRQGGGGQHIPTPGEGQTGQPPLASFHGSVRLLPNEALKALLEAGINLQSPSKGDRSVINDIRKYNKLGDYPWPEDAKPAGAATPEPGGSPRR